VSLLVAPWRTFIWASAISSARSPFLRVKLVELDRWPTRYGDCMPSLSQGEELCGGAAWARGETAAVEEHPEGRGERGGQASL
jgi:hypothetical protein